MFLPTTEQLSSSFEKEQHSMDAYDASKMILTRIQTLDPENASRIMGYILIQDLGDKELIRLAHGPENNLVSLINKAKAFLEFSQNGGTFHQLPSPRIVVPNGENNGFFQHQHHSQLKSPNLSCSPSSPWSNGSNGFSAFSRKTPISASYASVVNCGGGSSQSLNLSLDMNNSGADLGSDEFSGTLPFNFDESVPHKVIMSPSGRSDSVLWNYEDHSAPHANLFHRRSCSVNDAYLFEDGDGGGQNGNLLGGWRPCMYFARGFCKNGSTCKFSHTFEASNGDLSHVGSPNNMDGFERLRMKAIQQQRFAAASELMASSPPRHSLPYRRSRPAALMGEEFQKFGPCGPDMNSFPGLGLDCNSGSRQIYLTFPADSAFTEEDVSNYFSMYGPVEDVRIPYQQKRMFGFVTFVYAETVNLILAKGNPHFVCDYRVLVKPYKEKGKVAEKKRQQQLFDRGELPACLSPTGFDLRESYDLPFGGRTLYNTKELILKNQLDEQAELQQAIELQGRRLMNMHLMELKNNYNNHQSRPSFPPAFSLPSRLQTHPQMFHNIGQPSDEVNVEVQVNTTSLHIVDTPANVANENDTKEISDTSDDNNGCEGYSSKDAKAILEEATLQESLENIFPDSLFASPTKLDTQRWSSPERVPFEAGDNSPLIPSSNYKAVLSSISLAIGAAEPAKPCHFQMPRYLDRYLLSLNHTTSPRQLNLNLNLNRMCSCRFLGFHPGKELWRCRLIITKGVKGNLPWKRYEGRSHQDNCQHQ